MSGSSRHTSSAGRTWQSPSCCRTLWLSMRRHPGADSDCQRPAGSIKVKQIELTFRSSPTANSSSGVLHALHAELLEAADRDLKRCDVRRKQIVSLHITYILYDGCNSPQVYSLQGSVILQYQAVIVHSRAVFHCSLFTVHCSAFSVHCFGSKWGSDVEGAGCGPHTQ